MSKYTTEVRFICENAAGYDESKGFNDVDTIILDSIDSIFQADIPIFDPSYRNVICSKILRHYYTREIGFETVGLWKLKLNTKLKEIMPYYNQLYNSELIKFNPLYDTELQTTHVGDKNAENNRSENKTGITNETSEGTNSGSYDKNANAIEGENRLLRNNDTESNIENSKTSGDGVTNSDALTVDNEKTLKSGEYSDTVKEDSVSATNEKKYNKDLYSDTPQGALTDVESEEYLTNARIIDESDNKNDVTGKNSAKSGSNSETTNKDGTNISNGKTESLYNEEQNKVNVKNNERRAEEENSRTAINSENYSDNHSTESTSNKNEISNTVGNDKYTSTESYILHVTGKQSGISFSKMLKEFRETFLNIDMEIIKALGDLFLNLW